MEEDVGEDVEEDAEEDVTGGVDGLEVGRGVVLEDSVVVSPSCCLENRCSQTQFDIRTNSHFFF